MLNVAKLPCFVSKAVENFICVTDVVKLTSLMWEPLHANGMDCC